MQTKRPIRMYRCHGNVVALDMDLRAAWFPNSKLSRGLLVSSKWKARH